MQPPISLRKLQHTPNASVAIIGNAPLLSDHGCEIDAHDYVVRCNKAAGFGGVTGHRVNELVLVNSGGQMKEWLDLKTIEHSTVFQATPVIRLPIHPRKIDWLTPPLSEGEQQAAMLEDHTAMARARFASYHKKVRLFSAGHFPASVEALGHIPYSRTTPAASTGLLVVRWLVTFGNML